MKLAKASGLIPSTAGCWPAASRNCLAIAKAGGGVNDWVNTWFLGNCRSDSSMDWKKCCVASVRKHFTRDESALCAATGGALVCAVFGGVVGFALSGLSRDMGAIGGAILGGLLGLCFGFIFGVSVEALSSIMKNLLRSLGSK